MPPNSRSGECLAHSRGKLSRLLRPSPSRFDGIPTRGQARVPSPREKQRNETRMRIDCLRWTISNRMHLSSLAPLGIWPTSMIFPALQAMITHGHFDMPIIGVAKPAVELLTSFGLVLVESLEKHGWRGPSRVCSAFGKTPVRQRRLRLTRYIRASCERRLALRCVPFFTWLFPRTCLRPSRKAWPMQNATRGHGWSPRNHLAATFLRRRRST